MRRILCDTCALVWLSTGDARLSRAARTAMRDAELLCFSSISTWEIARKVKAGELDIPVTPALFADMLERHYGMKELPLDNAVMLRASSLPEIHSGVWCGSNCVKQGCGGGTLATQSECAQRRQEKGRPWDPMDAT